VIVEAKNVQAFGFNGGRARSICLLSMIGKMLPAVELDHQLGSVTHEVGDVILDRDLAPEAGAVEPMIAEFRPEDSFGVGGILSECARVGSQFVRHFPGWALLLSH